MDGVGVRLGRGVGEGLFVRVSVGEGLGVEVGIRDGLGVWVSVTGMIDGVCVTVEVRAFSSVCAVASGEIRLQADRRAAARRERTRYKKSFQIFIDTQSLKRTY
jgi:hypothetical protein